MKPPSRDNPIRLTRRAFVGCGLAAGVAGLTACTDRQSPVGFAMETAPSRQLNYPIEPYKLMYAGLKERDYRVPPVPYERMDPDNLRQIVHDPTVEPKGTIVIDEQSNYLYLILGDRKALRYGIAFGDRYRRWSGPCHVRRRERWPEQRTRSKFDRLEGHVAQQISDKEGATHPPYGSRALYIFQGSTDTELVIHGTSRWGRIGGPAPLGSILMVNQDVIDLYERTHTGTRVVIV